MAKIPTPRECGLPEKFDKWRAGQEEALSVIITNKKRATTVCAPTGFGKTPMYVAAALLSKVPTCIVTSTRGLQDQLMRDFASIGLVDIRGKKNYSCEARADCTCEEGHAAQCIYKGTVGCPASQAEMRAATSSLVVTNYAKWCASKKYGQGMSHFQQVIFDEAHDAPNALAAAMQVVLNHKEIEETLQVPFLKNPEAQEFAHWKRWAADTRGIAEIAMITAQARITGKSDPKPAWVRHYTHMRNLCKRLATVATANTKNWIVDEVETGYQFDPINPAQYAESALLLRVPKIVCVSATVRPKTMYMIGIGKDNFQFSEFDSDFDPKRCPIYYIPTMRVDNRAHSLSELWLKLDQIAAKRRDRKGIVHTVSYGRRDEILQASRYAGSMLVNSKGEDLTDIIEQFKAAGPGAILVSPSAGTGYDFAGRACEWQFSCKIPFAPPSKIQKARQALDNEYAAYGAMQTLVQQFGRSMRSREDQSESFICDDNLSWFLPRFGHLAPKSFHGFFRETRTVPVPPGALK